MGQPNVCPVGQTWVNIEESGWSLDSYSLGSDFCRFTGTKFSVNVSVTGSVSGTGTFLLTLSNLLGASVDVVMSGGNVSIPQYSYFSAKEFDWSTEYDFVIEASGEVFADNTATITNFYFYATDGVTKFNEFTSTAPTQVPSIVGISSTIEGRTTTTGYSSTAVGYGLPNQCQQLYRYLGNYEVTLDLAMKMRDNWNGNNTIFDWGSTADTYTFDGYLVTNDYSIWERLAGNATSPVLNTTGFNPFGTQFSGDVTGKRYPRYNGKANVHGEYQEWSGEMIMDSSGGYSYDTTAWVPTYATGFGIAGLAEFPVPEFTPVGVYSVAYNRIGKVIREYDSGEQSEQRKFEMKWENLSGEALRCILVKLVTVIRSNTFKIDFGTSLQRLSPWLPRAGELLSGEYDIRLSNSVIKYTYTGGSCEGGGSWSLELECIKWEA
jgi:hypothetical protein